jgi:hypothetical protein
MSTPSDPLPPSGFQWIRPAWFLAGLGLGLAGLSWLGWQSGRTDYHPGYVRLYPAVSPESSYYPTLGEMTAIVRGRCRRDQVLVIVGGNSILQGVWQPAAEIWSKRLQDLLGDGYCVINFAFRGAAPTDGGAVVAEALRQEFPRQVYIADEAPLTGVESYGHEPYLYLFWQAYFRGELLAAPLREARLAQYRLDTEHRRTYVEAAISVNFDRVFHFSDLWNRVTFERVATVPSYLGQAVPALLKPRREFPDTEPDATNPDLVAQRYPAQFFDTEMQIVRGPMPFYHRGADGQLVLSPVAREDLTTRFDEAFPQPLKRRTLMLIGQSSPYYVRRLSPDEHVVYDQAFVDTVQLWRDAGYAAIEYGRDFTDDDYGDRTHLSKLGGWKLAATVAPQVEAMAARLGYLR